MASNLTRHLINTHRNTMAWVLALIGLAATGLTQSQTLIPDATTVQSPGDAYGGAVAISGTTAVIGAFGAEADSGTAYLFDRVGPNWAQVAQINAPNNQAGQEFGWSVAIEGDQLAVGAPGDFDVVAKGGAVHVFERSNGAWTAVATLRPPGAPAGERFGYSVAISGDRLLVGAPNNDGNANGRAYVFDRVGGQWTFTQALAAIGPVTPKRIVPKGIGEDDFGFSVSLENLRAVVGAPEEDNAQGAAYVFDFSAGTWSLTQRLAPGFLLSEDLFGTSVSLSGNRVLVGVPGADNRQGGAEIFTFDGSTWNIGFDRLNVDDSTETTGGTCGDQLGLSVSLQGDFALIGAATDAVWGEYSGSAYLFQFYNDEWDVVRKITDDDGADNRLFGSSVALQNGVTLIGAPATDLGPRPCSNGAPVVGTAQAPQTLPDLTLGPQPDEFESDNTRATATPIAVGMQLGIDEFPQRHSLHEGADVDFAQFLFSASSNYTIVARPRDPTLELRLGLEDAHGNALETEGCSGQSGQEISVLPPFGLNPNQVLFIRVEECTPAAATGSRDYDLLVAGVGHQQCVLLEGTVSTAFTSAPAQFVWLFSDVNNTVITGPDGAYALCADFDIQQLTTFDPTGQTQPASIDVLAGIACAPQCIEPDYEDDNGNFRPRISPGTRAQLDFEVSGPIIFVDGFESAN